MGRGLWFHCKTGLVQVCGDRVSGTVPQTGTVSVYHVREVLWVGFFFFWKEFYFGLYEDLFAYCMFFTYV